MKLGKKKSAKSDVAQKKIPALKRKAVNVKRRSSRVDAAETEMNEHADEIKPTPQWRFTLVVCIVVIAGVFLSYRALNIQVIENDFLQAQGDARHLRTVALPAHRGMILDRNDEVLAMSTPVSTVWANPQKFSVDHQSLSQLAHLLNLPESQIKETINGKRNKKFVYIKRHINPLVAEQVKALKIPDLYVRPEYRRYYPNGEVMAHVIGFTNTDDVGIEGVEVQYNQELKGKPGKSRVLRDSKGQIIEAIDLIKASQPGKDIHLSLDKRLQYIVYRELKKTVKQHGAKSGSIVILDVHTGEVLALANEPSYNPNKRDQYKKSRFRNSAILDMYEPGSTMKPFVVAAALKAKLFSPDTLISQTAKGYYKVGKVRITDAHFSGELDVSGVVRKSSNVGMSVIALAMQPEEMWETLSDMGFGEKTRSNFPGEVGGYLPFYGEWKKITQATVSYGYGISVTSLQLAQSYAVFANGGYLNPVTLLSRDDRPEGRKVLNREVADSIMTMMESVVSSEGTAVKAKIAGYRVAGKTGTAKKLNPYGGYLDKSYLSIFAGIAPASDPRFVAVVMIDDPTKDGYYGGTVAAPLFSRVMGEALRLMNVAPDDLPPAHNELRIAAVGGLKR